MNKLSIDLNRKAAAKASAGLYLPDADGNPRWVWPAASNEPTFLQFFQAITWKQRAYVAIIRLVFRLRLQRMVFASVPLGPDLALSGKNWAVFTGTPGPNRKQVILADEGTIIKVAVGETAPPNLNNEAFFLRNLPLNGARFSFAIPQLLRHSKAELVMEKIPNRGTWSQLTKKHVVALEELRKVKPFRGPLSDWVKWATIHDQLNDLKNYPHPGIPKGLVDNLLQMVMREDREQPVSYGVAHGDFTPWNTLRTKNDQLAIIDWELAQTEMPLGFDFFHFHLQNGIMVARKTWSQIYVGMEEMLSPGVRTALFGTAEVDVDRYLRLYLIYHLSYYLSLYSQQKEWHQQIYWQMEVWSDALRSLSYSEDHRKDLLSLVFDELQLRDYAVLKMATEAPLALPATSDLDILVKNTDVRHLIKKIKQYPQLARCRVIRKSFMTSLLLILKDGQTLAVDLIWKLKRKATVFIDAGSMIRNARTNSYGVRVVSPADTRRYINLFYGLNGAPIPAKFGFTSTPSGDAKRLPENSGWSGIRNKVAYVVDTFRTMLFNRGVVITFSGVDGAGKSTIIEQVANMLDKEFRRPVKVLRHRPSILPILSAYRYGKEGAEKKSMATLPRTGKNTSLLSSLLRFGYYYSDYLIGQWYIFLRYTIRGYTIVYDRYYYDFLVDPRRTNLELPSWIPATGFHLLKKPAFNFFLFAHPDTILARKQELERATIVSLTKQYRSLFEEYGKNNASGIFTSIENVVLEDTLTEIRTALINQNI